MKLLLFDIDGTLLDTGGLGLGSLFAGLQEAFPQHVGDSECPQLNLAGATDSGVARDLFAQFGIPDAPEHREKFFAAYVKHLRAAFAAAESEPEPLHGVQDLLAHLRESTPHQLGILTGNTHDGAWTKLKHFGLADFFAFGSFGDDRETRNELGPVALERAEHQLGHSFEPGDSVIIGDTPKDIACARAFGGRVIAVATGSFSAKELQKHDPDAILDDLTDLSKFLEVLDSVIS